MTDFNGKQIIVTAGASGIGHSIATSFLKAGAAVHVVDVDENKTVVSFNKGKTVLSLDYKASIKRDTETKRLINIYSKK